MTLASSIISAAYRESNLVAIGSAPTDAENTEALDRLNTIILQSVGNELADLAIGGLYDESSYASDWVPANARLVVNQTVAQTFKLAPMPYEGQRLAVADAGNNFASYPLTLDGYGRLIEGATTKTISTNGYSGQWMYRADTANWVRLDVLALTDTMPLPVEFDDYFITRLALRLNPRNGVQLSQESLATLRETESAIRARYRTPRPQQDMGTLGLLGSRVRLSW